MEVVRHKAVAGALREERDERNEQHTLTITRRLHQQSPRSLRVRFLKSDGFLNFGEFGADELVLFVTIRMVLRTTLGSRSKLCCSWGDVP